jgi:hypothetical protein
LYSNQKDEVIAKFCDVKENKAKPKNEKAKYKCKIKFTLLSK